IQGIDRNQPIFGATTMTRTLAANQARRKFLAVLVAVFAVMATLVAGLGLFSLIAYSVSRRTHEVGVRVALGARPVDVVVLILGQGLALVSIGVLVGLLAAA